MPRCYILENDTVQCDTDLYRSLQAWKDHKLHIDHEVSEVISHAFSVCVFSMVFGAGRIMLTVFVSVCLLSVFVPPWNLLNLLADFRIDISGIMKLLQVCEDKMLSGGKNCN